MEDNDFLDLIYSQWAKTTGAEDHYWMEEQEDTEFQPDRATIFAVGEDQKRKRIAEEVRCVDADFITAVHGCFPDLIRRLREALDEADRLDEEKDELIGRVAELEEQADAYEVNEDRYIAQIDELNARLLSYSERLKEEESFSEGLINDNLNLERWLDNGGTV